MKKLLPYLLLLLLAGCTIHRPGRMNFASLYRGAHDLRASLYIHNEKPDSSTLYVDVDTTSIVKGENGYSLSLKVQPLQSFHSPGDPSAVDSVMIRMPAARTVKITFRRIIHPVSDSVSKLLYVSIGDLNSSKSFEYFLPYNPAHTSRNNYLLFRNNQISFEPYTHPGETAMIKLNTYLPTIRVRQYKRPFPLPSPPFSGYYFKPFDFDADSTFSLSVKEDSTVTFVPDTLGFYHFQPDTSRTDGFTLFSFTKGFPDIKTATDLLEPVRYITSKNEYNEIALAPNIRTAIEAFWIRNGGSPERGRELIRKYYSRVRAANSLFTSFLEGWKTDRGMIYIIFGPPNIVNKSDGGESWTYGEENNMMSLSFNFYKVKNPFSENDFALERSEVYKNSWYKAVDSWRQGRVY